MIDAGLRIFCCHGAVLAHWQLCTCRPLQIWGAWTQMWWACGRRARVVADARGRVKFRLRAKPDSADMDSLNVRETGAPLLVLAGLKFC